MEWVGGPVVGLHGLDAQDVLVEDVVGRERGRGDAEVGFLRKDVVEVDRVGGVGSEGWGRTPVAALVRVSLLPDGIFSRGGTYLGTHHATLSLGWSVIIDGPGHDVYAYGQTPGL